MKLKLKETPEQIELIKAMGSKNATASREASEAFAAFLGPVIQEVIQTAGTANMIYSDAPFNEDDNPSYPLDLYYNENDGYVTVWSQHLAGGLPTSQVEGVAEMKIATYRLDSAVSWMKRYARRSRLDVVSKAIERMATEVLIKQERNAWAVILRALAEASTNVQSTGSAVATKHIVASATEDKFVLGDMSTLMTRLKRINESFSGHTPVAPWSNGLTDLYVSPEVKQDIRAFSYSPIGNNANQSLPEDAKSGAYRGAGLANIFGINIVDLQELGVGQKYNTLYETFSDSAGLAGAVNEAGASTTTAFNDSSSHEVIIGVDASREALIRPVARNADSGATFSALPDDQYSQRADKTGFYGSVEEGRVCIDARVLAGAHLKRS